MDQASGRHPGTQLSRGRRTRLRLIRLKGEQQQGVRSILLLPLVARCIDTIEGDRLEPYGTPVLTFIYVDFKPLTPVLASSPLR